MFYVNFRERVLQEATFTDHFIERCKERNIDMEQINPTILKGTCRVKMGGVYQFIKDGICIVVNPVELVYITAYAVNKRNGVMK